MLSLVKKAVIAEIMGVIFYELMRLLKILKNIHQHMNIYVTKAFWVCSERVGVQKIKICKIQFIFLLLKFYKHKLWIRNVVCKSFHLLSLQIIGLVCEGTYCNLGIVTKQMNKRS